MRKKSLVFLALAAIILSACSYNPFNEFTGIDFNFSTNGGLNLFQDFRYLFWDKIEDCDKYEIHLYDDTSSSETEDKPILSTTNNYLEVKNEWVGKQIKVVAYKYDLSKGLTDATKIKVKVSTSKKITVTSPSIVSPAGNTLTVNDSYLNQAFGKNNYGIVKVSKDTTKLVIDSVTTNYYPTFLFEARDDDSLIRIDLKNSALYGRKNYSDVARFRYLGNNSKVDFYFVIDGINTISGTGDASTVQGAIQLPRVIFYDTTNYYSDTPELSVYGSNGASSKYTSSHAVRANRIISYLPTGTIKLYGGNGGKCTESTGNGGTGQMPIAPSTDVYTTEEHSIGIKAGDGGSSQSKNGKGGNAYTYRYLTNVSYKKYADAFYCIQEASVGSGTNGKGTLIDYLK